MSEKLQLIWRRRDDGSFITPFGNGGDATVTPTTTHRLPWRWEVTASPCECDPLFYGHAPTVEDAKCAAEQQVAVYLGMIADAQVYA